MIIQAMGSRSQTLRKFHANLMTRATAAGLDPDETGWEHTRRHLVQNVAAEAQREKRQLRGIEINRLHCLSTAWMELYALTTIHGDELHGIFDLMLSWRSDERPSVEVAFLAARRALEALNMADHAYVAELYDIGVIRRVKILTSAVHSFGHRVDWLPWLNEQQRIKLVNVAVEFGRPAKRLRGIAGKFSSDSPDICELVRA